jgi:uncharacterized protein (TIGR02266 family)
VGSERRRHPRLKLEIDVDVTSGHNFFSTRTRDASEGGVFIETDLPLPIGSKVRVVMRLPSSPGLEVDAEIAWTLADDHGGTIGLGLRFVDPSPLVHAAIVRFMKTRAPMVFDAEPSMEPEAGPMPPPLPRRPG